MGLTRPRAHQLQDIDYKQTARAVTSSNITLSGGTPATVDGVSLLVDDRVLVNGQTDQTENGIYYVTTLGSGSNGTWARTGDANATGEMNSGMIIMVTEGTGFADTQWMLTTDGTITIGTTNIVFAQTSSNAFGIVAVAGQDNLFADSVGDTLTIAAGTNLDLTTNASTDTLTITPSLTPAITSLTATGNISGLNILTGNVTIDDSGITATGNVQADMIVNREQRYTTSNVMRFNQLYTGASSGSYFTNGEYQKVVTITPNAASQNYQVLGTITAQNAGETHTVNFNAALRSNTLPALGWSIFYNEQYNGSRYIDPQLWTKQTTTAGFIFAFKTLGTIYGTVTVDITVIPRNSSQLSNVSVNTVQNSEQTSVDAGFTANDMEKVITEQGENVTIAGTLTGTTLVVDGLTYPTADGTNGQVLQTNGSGTLSFADTSPGGATVSSDTSTNAERLIYVGSITTGTLSAVTQDSGLTYNPSTGTLTSAGFSGSGASLTALNGSNISTGTVAAARVATLNQNTTGTAGGLSSAVTVSLTGDVTGSATFTNAGDTASISTTIAANSVALGTDTTGNFVGAGATSGSGISGSVSNEGGTFTVTSNATSASTANTIVFRDGSGNFSAGTITATSTSAQYADLAEKYTTDQEYPIGTVMKVSTHDNYETDAATIDSIAIGVISYEPAYLMNSDSEGQAIGLKGRVPVRVIGAVNKGDAVYCSNNGTASAEFNGCCLVGIALESNSNESEKLVECVLKV